MSANPFPDLKYTPPAAPPDAMAQYGKIMQIRSMMGQQQMQRRRCRGRPREPAAPATSCLSASLQMRDMKLGRNPKVNPNASLLSGLMERK